MKNILSWVGVLKYAFGVLAWMAIFAFLQFQCVFNVGSFVDSLWQKNLHDGLVRNLIGKIAYRAGYGYGDYGCGDRYIYTVLYKPGRQDDKGKYKSLSSLVDVKTWKADGQDGIDSYFIDSNHKYTLRTDSDGADITAVDK